MKITFLGTGNASTLPESRDLNECDFQSNILLESGNRKLLLDCGGDIRFSLMLAGKRLIDITDVYISHLHADHTGGLEHLMFNTYFHPAIPRPNMFINEKLSVELWTETLRGGAGSLQGRIADLPTYFDVHAIGKNGTFIWEGVEFRLVQVIHYMDGFDIVPSYGLLFKPSPDAPTIFWTSDTQFCPVQIRDFYAMSDLIFHDCETIYRDGKPGKSGVHAHYADLVTLPEATKAKMHLYHYHPGEKPDCVADGFAGWIKRGQVFEF
jgi:ribonuclease BN (tRNA processing enzyme)